MIIIANKPYGILSQFNENPDYPEQETLKVLGLPPELLPVGRLDMDSEGLLLLTDEKAFESALMNPKRGHKRAYLVQVSGHPDKLSIDELRAGNLEIRGYRTKKCRATLLKEDPGVAERVPPVDLNAVSKSSWLRMELTEGKNRQVRRMTAKVGHPTLRLIRVQIGMLEVPDLAPGEWRVISEDEREMLFANRPSDLEKDRS